MRFTSTLFLAGLSLAQKWEGFEALPNGAYQGQNWANGSTTVHALDDASFSPVTLHLGPAEAEKREALEKRFVDCWNIVMDPIGTDVAVQGLRDWAGVSGGQSLFSGSTNAWHAQLYEGMMAYYCINAPNTSGNLNLVDVNYALSQMDATCARYTASYFEWPGTVEIVGKCAQGTAICLG